MAALWCCQSFLFIAAVFSVSEVCGLIGQPPPEVTVMQGRLSGAYLKTNEGKVFEGFMGIPYAKPPIGDNRFKPPKDPKPWKGVYNASEYGSDCLQYTHVGYKMLGAENCLFLNVFRPEASRRRYELLPVIVHIHGGAFMFLSGSVFGPNYIMKDDNIIYVSLNYRLGPLGFMSTGDRFLPGNLGLKDQVAALRWVRDNIRQFGGNPDSVTITGISAGGVSVHYQYLSPLSRGLFHRGISSSGAVLNPWALAEDVPEKTRQLAASLGCPTYHSEELVDCLKYRPAEQIVKAVPQFLAFYYNPYSPFGPVLEPDGTEYPFLTRDPYDLIRDGQTAKVPWLASFTTEEGLYPAAEFIENKNFLQKLESKWFEMAPHLLDYNYTVDRYRNKDDVAIKIKQYYLKGKTVPDSPKELIQMVGDRLFGSGIVQSVLMQAETSPASVAPVYMYRFGYRGKHSASEAFTHSSNDHGVAHADDGCYILKTPYLNPETRKEDLDMMKQLVNLWLSFATKGVPEFPEGSRLPVAQDALPKLKYLEIRSPTEASVETVDDLAEFNFWSSLTGLKEKLYLPRSAYRQEL